ncbi:MAG: 16S rRNA (guanine(966)-N(2))-methyltransferase RsmD [Deltaproteobacteria bacterium]|nr:16S rRNA (guanine(966)-N(2))-methyltransferase RsmD [Deltaproteobacteria bacterium]
MRVVGGAAKGRTLIAPRSGDIRITADRIKESLFDILGAVEGKSFLDLFAGTGNVGIEALSRGADPVLFVEKNRRHCDIVRKNVELCGFTSGCEIVEATVDAGIRRLAKRRVTFDIIFADPPYEQDLVRKTLQYIGEEPLLSENGVFVMEHSTREECAGTEHLVVIERRKYGDTVLSFLTITQRGE